MDDEKDAIFFVALCLCYFHPQIGIPDAKVTIITHLSFSQQFWRMQQIPKPEIRYTECFIWFYKHIHSLVFSIWIRDLKHSFKQKNWNSFFIYNLLWHEDQIAGTVEHFLSINQTASQYLGVQTHSRHWIRLLSTQSSMMTRAGERWDGMQLHIKFFDLTESQK